MIIVMFPYLELNTFVFFSTRTITDVNGDIGLVVVKVKVTL